MDLPLRVARRHGHADRGARLAALGGRTGRRGDVLLRSCAARSSTARVDFVFAVRRFVDADFRDLVTRWHETNRASYPYSAEQQRHSLQDALSFFESRV